MHSISHTKRSTFIYRSHDATTDHRHAMLRSSCSRTKRVRLLWAVLHTYCETRNPLLVLQSSFVEMYRPERKSNDGFPPIRWKLRYIFVIDDMSYWSPSRSCGECGVFVLGWLCGNYSKWGWWQFSIYRKQSSINPMHFNKPTLKHPICRQHSW